MKEHWTTYFSNLSLIILTLFFVFIIGGCSKNKDNAIVIGAVLPLTGDGAKYGVGAKEGIDLALDEINSSGGLLGKKVSVIYDDSKLNPADGVAAITRMIDTQKVNIIIGDIGSSVTMAMAPIAKQKGAILLSPASSSPKITGMGIFRIWPSDTIEGKTVAEYLRNKRNIKKVAVLYINNDYGMGLKDVFEATFVKMNGTVVLSEAYDQGNTDFRSVITKIKNKNPEAVYLAGYYSEIALILRQSKEMGFKTNYFSCVGVYEPQFLDLAKNAAEGLIFSAPAYDPNSKDPATSVFVKKYFDRGKKEPGIFQAHGYDSLKILAAAITKANSIDSQSVRKELLELKNYAGATGVMTFDANGDVDKSSRLLQIKNGQFLPLE